jgi:aminoglycoside/choline kinase family phosphotransferase
MFRLPPKIETVSVFLRIMTSKESLQEIIEKLIESAFSEAQISRVEKLPQSGGERQYFRVFLQSGETYIATFNEDVRENKTFLYFNDHFSTKGISLPKIYAVDDNNKWYLQQDLGQDSLFSILEREGHSDRVFDLYKKSLQALATLQIHGDDGLDYSYCLQSRSFGKDAMMNDLLYFRFYFLDTMGIPYSKEVLWDEMTRLCEQLDKPENLHFMYRDFQSRNIMVQDDQVFFIDHQGGMKGSLMYDVASLLWQAKAQLSAEWKEQLLQHYFKSIQSQLPSNTSFDVLREQYEGMVLIRLLQVLGAYGFRGKLERKTHFLSSIPGGLKNIREFLAHAHLLTAYPLLKSLLEEISTEETIQSFIPPHAHADSPLTVRISSFSFLQNGYPACAGKQGGGFVFDCRGILNPGRIDVYKTQSGLDQPVRLFLEQETKMPNFLNAVYEAVDIAVEDYLSRGFDALEIHFGCTGGQHRSVFAAESLNKYLQKKYGVRTVVQHLNQTNWVR